MSAFDLNEAQRVAATTLAGPVLVTAGAGSGKTRVLTERAANAVRSGAVEGWEPISIDQILAITYTDKAAGELAERVRAALRVAGLQDQARRVDAAWISTIHGMCSRILRLEALEAGIDPAFRVLDGVETGRLQEQALEAAVTALLDEQGSLRLLGLYDFQTVASTVFALADDLRTRDVSADALTVSVPDTAAELAREATVFFGLKAAFFDSCGLDTPAVHDHGTACTGTFETLRDLSRADLREADLAEAVWHVLRTHRIARTYAGVKDHVASIRQERSDLCARLATLITAPASKELARLTGAYTRAYSTLKRQAGGLDFNDLQVETRRLLRRPEIRQRWSERFALSMVDEFQDTDELQLEVVSALAGANLCTVGDERQSIYRFRGADVDVYRAHSAAMIEAGATPATLAVNYRSHPDLLCFVNRLFGDPALFGEQLIALEPGRLEPEPPVLPAGDPRVEVLIAPMTGTSGGDLARGDLAGAIAERVRSLHVDSGVSPGDIVVLMPTYKYAHVYAAALADAGIETVVIGGSRFFDQHEVCALRSAMRVVVNPLDETAVAELLVSDLCGLSDDALVAARQRSRVDRQGLWAAAQVAELDHDDSARLAVVSGAVRRAAESLGRISLSETMLRFVEDCGYDLRLFSAGLSGSQAYANVLKFARLCAAFESSQGTGLAGFLAHLDAKQQFAEHETPAALAGEDSSAVRIMSIHASKGLEFPIVIVPELGSRARNDSTAARWGRAGDWTLAMSVPSSWGSDSDRDLRMPPVFAELAEHDKRAEAEERQRLFYVACTRAREVLVLAGARTTGRSVSSTMLNWVVDALGIALEPGSESSVALGGGAAARVRVLAQTAIGAAGEASSDVLGPRQPGSDEWYELLMRHGSRETPRAEAPRRLSFSGLSLFDRCALRFHAEKVLGLGVSAELAGPAVRRGSALHTLLQVAGEDGALDETRLAAVARQYRLGAGDAQRVRRALDAYRASVVADEVRAMDTVRREAPFALWVGAVGEGFVLDGTIDVYARSGDRALIVDYKTGESAFTQEELAHQFQLQARCYALAAARDGARVVDAVFVRPEVCEAGKPQSIRFRFTADDAREFAVGLAATHHRMSTSSWEPRDGWDEHACSDCPVLAQMCPVKSAVGARRV